MRRVDCVGQEHPWPSTSSDLDFSGCGIEWQPVFTTPDQWRVCCSRRCLRSFGFGGDGCCWCGVCVAWRAVHVRRGEAAGEGVSYGGAS
jgi:hypothetical protein